MHMTLEGKRVFVVEDDVLLQMTLQDMLSDFGCTVSGFAMSLDQALQIARDISVDLAILDVNLNGKLVTPAAELLAQRGVPILFSTGYRSDIVPSLVGRPLLSKPYTEQQLKAAMLRALAA